MRRIIGAVCILAAALAAPALGAAPAGLKATVKDSSSTSRDIAIVNGTKQAFTGFFINATDNPKITAASNKACKLGTSPWKDSAGKKHVDYWANCAAASVAAGKTLDITLTTSGNGTILVNLAPPHTIQELIGSGT